MERIVKSLIYYTFLFLILENTSIFCQIPEKEKLFEGYSIGDKVVDSEFQIDVQFIKDYFVDTTNLYFLIQGVDSKRFHNDSIDINRDIMYNKETKNFEFLIYGGKYIPTEEPWGLYDYYFVIIMELDLTQEGTKNQFVKTKIIKDKDNNDLKDWWRSYMRSYKEPKYAKKELADKYGMVPPPPPPPETKEWF